MTWHRSTVSGWDRVMLLPASCAFHWVSPAGPAWEAATLLPSRSCFSLFGWDAGGRGDGEKPAGRLEAEHTCIAHTHAARMHVTYRRTLHVCTLRIDARCTSLPRCRCWWWQRASQGTGTWLGNFWGGGRNAWSLAAGSVARLCLHQSLHQSLHWCSCEPRCARLLRQISPGRAPSSSPFHLGFFAQAGFPKEAGGLTERA